MLMPGLRLIPRSVMTLVTSPFSLLVGFVLILETIGFVQLTAWMVSSSLDYVAFVGKSVVALFGKGIVDTWLFILLSLVVLGRLESSPKRIPQLLQEAARKTMQAWWFVIYAFVLVVAINTLTTPAFWQKQVCQTQGTGMLFYGALYYLAVLLLSVLFYSNFFAYPRLAAAENVSFLTTVRRFLGDAQSFFGGWGAFAIFVIVFVLFASLVNLLASSGGDIIMHLIFETWNVLLVIAAARWYEIRKVSQPL